MSDDSDNLSDISSLIDKDVSGHELARFLMSKARGGQIHRRLFGGDDRRVSVQVELTKPADKEKDKDIENNVQRINSENIAPSTESESRQQSSSPLRANNATENAPVSPKTLPNKPKVTENMDLDAQRSPARVVPKTPEALSRQALLQTPKSSQPRVRLCSSDRYRRRSFRQAFEASARRVLLNDLNGAEDSCQFSQFEPVLMSHPECTSTPATNAHFSKNEALGARSTTTKSLHNAAVTLRHGNREYSIQRGAEKGQLILTPSHLPTHKSPPNRTQLNQTSGKGETQIEEQTNRNVNVNYSRPTRAIIDHDTIEQILTEESDSSDIDCQDQADTAATSAFHLQNLASVTPRKSIRNTTFVRPRTPIHKNTTRSLAIARMDTESADDLVMSAVSRNQTSGSLPLVVKTRVQTEIFDDDTDSPSTVNFTTQETEVATNRQKRVMKRKHTPPYVKDYKNATQNFKTKGKRLSKIRSKRSLYSMNDGEASNKSTSPLACEVTSSNAVTTPVHYSSGQSERQARSSRSHKTVSSSPVRPPQKSATTQKISQKCPEEETQSTDTQPTQRRSRSRSKKILRKRNSRQRAVTQSPERSSSAKSQATPERCTNVERNLQTRSSCRSRASSHSPSFPLQQNDDQSPTSKRQRTPSQGTHRSSSSSTRSTSRSPTLLHRQASPQQSSDEASANEQTIIQQASEPENEQNSPLESSAGDPNMSPQETLTQKEPTSIPDTENQNQLREGGAPKSKTRGRSKSSKYKKASTALNVPGSVTAAITESDCPNRRSQRERKPNNLNPYALEMYTRAYFPERYKTIPKKKVNTEKVAEKRKIDNSANQQKKFQPLVKLRRLDLNSDNSNEHGDANEVDTVEAEPDALVAWLKSTTAFVADSSGIDDTNIQYDEHFMSRSQLRREFHCQNSIEFRFYNDNPQCELSFGYVIFKPKAVKKMVVLRHCSLRFVCVNGRFKFKVLKKDATETKEYISTVGDGFKVGVGDKYGIESLHESEITYLMMMKVS